MNFTNSSGSVVAGFQKPDSDGIFGCYELFDAPNDLVRGPVSRTLCAGYNRSTLTHDRLGGTGRAAGFWLEELAAPYCRFEKAAWEITLASPKGGQPPLDPKSNEPGARTDQTRRFEADTEVMTAPANTVRLVAVDADDYDTLFHPGCHGPLWDLADDTDSARLTETTPRAGKPLAPVCHAPGVLRHARNEDGTPLVQGRKVTGATNTEEDGVQLTEVVPFLVEDELGKLGGHYTKPADWQPYVVQDGLLITGRNPASSGPAADAPWTTPYAPGPSSREPPTV